MSRIVKTFCSIALVIMGIILAMLSFTACARVANADGGTSSVTTTASTSSTTQPASATTQPTAAVTPATSTDNTTNTTTTTTQSQPATTTQSNTTTQSTTAQVQGPKQVPLPAQSSKIGEAAVLYDGRWATQWAYVVAGTTPATVLSFYQNNMSANGWTYISSSPNGRNGGQVLQFDQGVRICYVEVLINHANASNTSLYITVTN